LVPDLLLEEHLPIEARLKKEKRRQYKMQDGILKLYVKAQILWNTLKEDEGQDLVEYGLVLVLVCLAATAGMNTLASGINVAMSNITNKLAKYTS
jgi:pilus assembly protein Flp/PilA